MNQFWYEQGVGIRALLHLAGHVLIPGLIARLCFRKYFARAWLLMLLANLVDVDHLWADPIYAPNRCSIGYHPLHSLPAILVYVLLLMPARARLLAVGLLLHMAWDQVDCWFM